MWPWLSSLNALLFSKMSVLSPASTLSSLLCSLTSPAGSFQPSDLCLLFPLLFPLLPCHFWNSQLHILSPLCNVKTFPLASILVPRWSVPYPRTPPAPVCSVPSGSFPSPHPFKGIPPYLGEWGPGKVKEDVGELDYGINEGRGGGRRVVG